MKAVLWLIGAGLCLLAPVQSAVAMQGFGIVRSVTKAPIVPDGDVASARSDFVINLDIDMDPAFPGITMAAGDQLRIILPAAFELSDTKNYPIANLGSLPTCVPGDLKCTTGVLLQGWPQNPLSPATYNFDLAGNVISFTATADIGVNPSGPGLKQAHFIGNGMRNPGKPGLYRVKVELERDGSVETGSALIVIRPDIRPSINVTSVFDVPPDDPNGGNPPNPNFIYQQTAPGQSVPLIWNFLLWKGDGEPFTDVEIQQLHSNSGRLVLGHRAVGAFKIRTPDGSVGQHLMSLEPSTVSSTPVIGMTFEPPLMTARLRAVFTAGSALGRYEIFLHLRGGNTAQMIVDVVD